MNLLLLQPSYERNLDARTVRPGAAAVTLGFKVQLFRVSPRWGVGGGATRGPTWTVELSFLCSSRNAIQVRNGWLSLGHEMK
jgi:hypothetical protein